jgi:hypothetical protein
MSVVSQELRKDCGDKIEQINVPANLALKRDDASRTSLFEGSALIGK